jgi:hypothetical protein
MYHNKLSKNIYIIFLINVINFWYLLSNKSMMDLLTKSQRTFI